MRAHAAEAAPGELLVYVEQCAISGAVATVGGWAHSPRGAITEITIILAGTAGEDAIRAVGGLLRADVAAHFGEAAGMAGFVATGLLALRPGMLRLVARLADGTTLYRHLGAIVADPLTGAPCWTADPGTRDGAWNAAASFAALPPARYFARSLGALGASPPAGHRSGRPVSLLASIFEGAAFLDAFFAGLRERTQGYDEIVLVDNGNTDAALVDRLAAEAARLPRCRLIRRPVNEGYIRGIGAAFAARTLRGHVVVLNTDLDLPEGWLPRLLWPLDTLPDVATATPFTNAGTSCSFPLVGIDNAAFLGLGVAAIDRAFHDVDPARVVVELPSGVGFCMAMHGGAIDAVGWFDERLFGFGYSEENDWCMRARARGWRDLLVPNLFVYHRHGGSYPAGTKRALLDRNLRTIALLHPDYFTAVDAYFATDPAAALRAILAFRLGCAASARAPRALHLRLDDDPRPALALAAGDPLVLVLRHPDEHAWSAVLAAGGHRGQVWGWGRPEIATLLAAAGVLEG